MDVAVHAALLLARRVAAEVYPAVGTIDLEVERLSVRLVLLAVPAPAVEKPVRAGGDPFLVTHIP